MMGDLQVVRGVKKLNNKNYNTLATLMESYLEGQNLWEIVCGNDVKPPTKDATLNKWNIKARKAMFTIKSTIEEEMPQHIKNAKTPKEAWDTFATFFFSKKNNTWLQLLENELLLISQRNIIVDEYFNKVKSLCHEISELDPTIAISESRMKRIIIHSLRLEFWSFVTAVQGWPTQPTIAEFENLCANQEAINKQMSRGSIKNDEEALFTDKKRYRFRRHCGGGYKGDADKS